MQPEWGAYATSRGAHGAHMQSVGAHMRPEWGAYATHFFISGFKRISSVKIYLVNNY
mgnify:CR=1 FL=1